MRRSQATDSSVPIWSAIVRRLSEAVSADPRVRAALRVRLMRPLRWVLPNLGHPGSLPTEELRPADKDKGPDFLVWSLIDWHFRFQRPQQLARELAKAGNRVFYLSCNLVDHRAPGFRVELLDPDRRLFQVFLHVKDAPPIYFESPSDAANKQLIAGMEKFLNWIRAQDLVSLVEHPFWYEVARSVTHGQLLYDRMDFHEGFGTFSDNLTANENALMREADLTIVSSAWLDRHTARYTNQRLLLRNAGEFSHFAHMPQCRFQDPAGRRIIGYYGAIADWVDLDLVAAVAKRFDDCLILLIGHDQCQAAKKLSTYKNVRILGEVPYRKLPSYLYGFDVCILPFRVIPLTLATNPVKVYEYLSAGKPVVAVDLPELEQFGDLVTVAKTEPDFLRGIARYLQEPEDVAIIARQRAFASTQTWKHRVATLIAAIESLGSQTTI